MHRSGITAQPEYVSAYAKLAKIGVRNLLLGLLGMGEWHEGVLPIVNNKRWRLDAFPEAVG